MDITLAAIDNRLAIAMWLHKIASYLIDTRSANILPYYNEFLHIFSFSLSLKRTGHKGLNFTGDDLFVIMNAKDVTFRTQHEGMVLVTHLSGEIT